VKVDKHHFATAVDVLGRDLSQCFDVKEVNRERTVVIEEINMYRDTPDSSYRRHA
jgi:predicted Zn-dependent peptidase